MNLNFVPATRFSAIANCAPMHRVTLHGVAVVRGIGIACRSHHHRKIDELSPVGFLRGICKQKLHANGQRVSCIHHDIRGRSERNNRFQLVSGSCKRFRKFIPASRNVPRERPMSHLGMRCGEHAFPGDKVTVGRRARHDNKVTPVIAWLRRRNYDYAVITLDD